MNANDRRSKRGDPRKTFAAVSLLFAGCVGTLDGGIQGQEAGQQPGDPTPYAQAPVPAVAGCQGTVNPGHVVVHRLNRVEYNNTIRDLLGITSQPADEFPPDDSFGGFDNNSSALNVAPDLLGQFDGAAWRLADNAVGRPGFISCDPAATGHVECAARVLAPLTRRAWRRPVTSAEIDELARLVTLAESKGATFTEGMAYAVEAILMSPYFLFRVEYPPTQKSMGAYSLDAYSLASRLSYFLWSSMPDDTLLGSAASGALLQPQELAAHVTRMLGDPRASALADNLAGQWLGARVIPSAEPDLAKFPRFDPALRASIPMETSLFLQAFFQENRDLRTLLDADFTFLNARLAQHYGIKDPGIKGSDFTRVALGGNQQRGGILTQATFLIATSKPNEPVMPRRGKWVLENLLCRALPPPPMNAAAEQEKINGSLPPNATQRQISAARMARPECGVCHKTFDPIGLALEKYDADGSWRETDDNKQSINTSGTLNGISFTGPRKLSALLEGDSGLPGCITNALFRYSLGRITSDDDRCLLDDITRSGMDNSFRAQDVIAAIVKSPAFRFQTE